MDISLPNPNPNFVQKALILDFNNEYGEFGIKSIALEHVSMFTQHPHNEIRRLLPFKKLPSGKHGQMSTTEMAEAANQATSTFRGGCLVIEDINKYVTDNQMPPDITGKLTSNRHSDMDMIMHYQSVARPLPIVWQNTNLVRYHCQMDPVEKSRNKLTEKTEIFKLAEALVNQKYYREDQQRYFVFVDLDRQCLIGRFSNEEFKKACQLYVEKNPAILRNHIIYGKMNGMNQTEAFNRAMEKVLSELQEFNGNLKKVSGKEREALTMLASGRKGVGKTFETIRFLREEYCPGK